MLFLKTTLISVIGLAIGAPAIASMSCAYGTISGNVEAGCVATVIPNHAAGKINSNCRGYNFIIDCDLTSESIKLALSITNPKGETVSTSTKYELKAVDANGDGAFVRCENQ